MVTSYKRASRGILAFIGHKRTSREILRVTRYKRVSTRIGVYRAQEGW